MEFWLATHRTRSCPRVLLERFHPVGTLIPHGESWLYFTQESMIFGGGYSVVEVQIEKKKKD